MTKSDQNIPDEDYVYRQTVPRDRTGKKKRKFPNESHFQLRDGERGLSVNWTKHITLREIFLLISITYGRNNIFLDHTIFKIFKYPVSLFRNIDQIKNVIHSPLENGDPAPVGMPNNPSHSEVLYENDMEIFVKLSHYCDQNFENAYCNFDVNSINRKSGELRAKLNDTKYHRKDWKEEDNN